MKTFRVPSHNDVPTASQQALDGVKKGLGMIPNLYATIGYSGTALPAYLQFTHAFEGSKTFRNREIQAIYLAVSEANDCSYCLAAHTALGKMNGFTEEETFDLRTGTIADNKLRVLTQLARSFVLNQGRPDQALVDNFFALGYDEAAFIEFVGLITVKLFSNYVHNSTNIPVDFPAAKPVPELEAAF